MTKSANRPTTSHINRIRSSRFLRMAKIIFLQNRLAAFGLIILLVVGTMAIFSEIIAPYDPLNQHFQHRLEPPSSQFWLGTDKLGRDIFSRIVFGSRLSMKVSLSAVGFAILIGVPLGLVSGYFRGYIDNITMRILDIVFAFPAILLALSLVVVLGQSVINLILALGIVYTPIFARVTRSGSISVREETYVTAAKAIGDSHFNIIRKDILPNIIAPIIVQASISIAFAILAEAGLSFIGVGTPPPTPSWGRMLSSSRSYLSQAWWWATFPGLVIMLTILAWNFIGDGLRDALDPRTETREGGGL